MKYVYHKGKLIVKLIVAVVLVFFTAAPVIYLICGAVASAITGETPFIISLDMGLLIKSVLIYIAAALLCVLFGFLVALYVWVVFEKKAVKIASFIMLMILIPPFIHVQSWIYFVDKLNAFISQIFGITQNFTGEFAVILTLAFSYLPITAGLCLMALLSVPQEMADQCRLEDGGKKTLFMIYLPLVLPALITSGLLVFLLNINDYGIPSIFGVNVFSLELFARYSADGNIYSVFFASIPLLILCLMMLCFFGFYTSRLNFSLSAFKGNNPFKKDKFVKTLAVFGFIILAFFSLVPIINLLYEALMAKDVFSVLSGSLDEFLFSVSTSSLSAIICIVPAVIFAFLYYKLKHKILLIALAALPFLIPSAISGLSLIKMWNIPLLQNIYQSPIMTTIAMIARFTFIEALIISFAMQALDKALLDNIRVFNPGLFGSFKCIISLIFKECLAGILIVFALSMSEFGVTLLVTPPGYQTVTIKIYNYLHYGASDIVAVLCLFMLFVMLVISLIVFCLLNGEENDK